MRSPTTKFTLIYCYAFRPSALGIGSRRDRSLVRRLSPDGPAFSRQYVHAVRSNLEGDFVSHFGVNQNLFFNGWSTLCKKIITYARNKRTKHSRLSEFLKRYTLISSLQKSVIEQFYARASATRTGGVADRPVIAAGLASDRAVSLYPAPTFQVLDRHLQRTQQRNRGHSLFTQRNRDCTRLERAGYSSGTYSWLRTSSSPWSIRLSRSVRAAALTHAIRIIERQSVAAYKRATWRSGSRNRFTCPGNQARPEAYTRVQVVHTARTRDIRRYSFTLVQARASEYTHLRRTAR
ncbi:unnamed protein product [Trichogramma brassicae]|uniref:Uncharacterized protein n=1 Tax=Trichogramma brassicae TaxID=86971 RepID=A0A6H5I9N0_9HYME|nr:unnamed protein product [Trichogramma brassicae]